MPSPISSQCHTVESFLLSAKTLAVPYFQRGYAWQTEHAERLLQDLIRHALGSEPLDWYPLGNIIVTGEGGAQGFDIADGHQRLITLTIILAALRDLEYDLGLRSRLGLCLADDGRQPRLSTLRDLSPLLLAAVQTPGAMTSPVVTGLDDLSPSQSALLDNREAIQRRIVRLTPEERRDLALFVLERTWLVVVSVGEEGAARLLFTSLHETGIRPHVSDLLKSRALGLCGKDVRELAQSVWESLESRLGRERMEGLFQDLATLQTRTVPSDTPDAAVGRAFDLDSADGVGSFILDHLRPVGRRYVEMLAGAQNPAAAPGPVFRRLQYLSWVMRHDTWRLPVLHWLRRRDFDDPETLLFLRRLEALAWCQMIRAEDISRRDRRYIELLAAIDADRQHEPGGPLDITADEKRAVRAVLIGANFIRRPYKLFLLLRINASLEGDGAVSIAPEATVEHVFPQRPMTTGQWTSDFVDEGEAALLRHTLGNLTLLTEREQNAAGNRDFVQKREIYARSAFPISQDLGRARAWGPGDIRRRTLALTSQFMASLGLE